jgi:hypothetical protein
VTIGVASAQAASAGTPTTATPQPDEPTVHALTQSQLEGYLRAAAHIKRVPADLEPPLSDSHEWGPLIVENGCQLSVVYLVMSQPCVYGDTDAQTSVALFGDSHAGMWFPALDQISIQRHWRLLIFTKAGCSPPQVTLYPECNVWRQNAEAQIAAFHPAIVFVSWARWIEDGARAAPGVPVLYRRPWLNGIEATFELLRKSSGQVIFISDDPTLDFGGAHCLENHLDDVKPCNSYPRKRAIFLPKIRSEEFKLADLLHVPAIDPTPWFCTATVCPVLVHGIMVYYDSAHMTPPWSSFIEPLLNRAITSTLSAVNKARPS